MQAPKTPSAAPGLAWVNRIGRGLIWVGVATLLAAVFALYARGDFLLTLANQLWACF